MRLKVLIISALLSLIGSWVFFIWMFISFVIYLAKDKPFEWFTLIGFIACVFGAVAAKIISTKTK